MIALEALSLLWPAGAGVLLFVVLFLLVRQYREKNDGKIQIPSATLRAQILVSFRVGEVPGSPRGLLDRAIRSESLAEVMAGMWNLPFPVLLGLFDAEASRMVTDGLLVRPDPCLDDHFKPPRMTYSLTTLGATVALEELRKLGVAA